MKKTYKIISFFLIAVFGGIIGSQLIWPYFAKKNYNINSDQPNVIVENKEIRVTQDSAFEEAALKVMPLVVGFYSDPKTSPISGTGLVLTRDGLAVVPGGSLVNGLNYHFIISGKEYKYEILKSDYKNNLTLVKLDSADFKTLDLLDKKDLRLGQKVFSLTSQFDFSENPLEQYYSIGYGFIEFLKKDNFGLSFPIDYERQGSPLFDIKGNIVGLIFIQNREIKIIDAKILKDLIEFSQK